MIPERLVIQTEVKRRRWENRKGFKMYKGFDGLNTCMIQTKNTRAS
jgi:hypothetical protein